jgi:hypothetical protein
LIDEVGEGALESFDGGVFVVGAGGTFEEAQEQDSGLKGGADAESDGAQHYAEGGLGFAFACTVIDMNLACEPF